MNVDVMQDASEIVHYDKPGIPLYIRFGKLSYYPNMKALCHWHEDIEFMYILTGKMYYYIDGKQILLKANDCIMINAKHMHYGFSCCGEDSDFICILFHPSLFTACHSLYRDYILSVTENKNLDYLYFDSRLEENQQIPKILQRIFDLKSQGTPGYELEIIGNMHILWNWVYALSQTMYSHMQATENPDLSSQKKMVSYIYQHYSEKVTLDHIAAAGNVCRSKCCAIFRHYLQQSPIEFLNAYRLKVSANLLKSTDENITQIALTCGFRHLSYFSKLFYDCYGCTPGEYRKADIYTA